MGETGDTMNTEACRDNPEDDEPAEILTENAGYGRGKAQGQLEDDFVK